MTTGLAQNTAVTGEEKNQPSAVYARSYRAFHWAMGIGFSILLLAGQQFNLNLTDAYRMSGLRYHSSIGSIVLVAALILLIKRFIRRDARPSSGLSGIKLLSAHCAQLSLYFLAVFIPLSGIATAYYSELPTLLFGLFDLARGAHNPELYARIRLLHELATFAGIALAAMHISAALYHHFIKKDEVLKSMIGKK